MLNINLTGTESVFAKFKALDDALKSKVVTRLAEAVYDDVEQAVDKHTKTGTLFQSLRLKKVSDGYEIYHDLQRAPHALFVHWGTKPHVIKPKDKKSLRWPSGNGFVFAKFVKHPGYKGDPYMDRAATNAPRHFEQIIRDMRL